MIRRPPRSTHCISSAASDVYKRQDFAGGHPQMHRADGRPRGDQRGGRNIGRGYPGAPPERRESGGQYARNEQRPKAVLPNVRRCHTEFLEYNEIKTSQPPRRFSVAIRQPGCLANVAGLSCGFVSPDLPASVVERRNPDEAPGRGPRAEPMEAMMERAAPLSCACGRPRQTRCGDFSDHGTWLQNLPTSPVLRHRVDALCTAWFIASRRFPDNHTTPLSGEEVRGGFIEDRLPASAQTPGLRTSAPRLTSWASRNTPVATGVFLQSSSLPTMGAVPYGVAGTTLYTCTPIAANVSAMAPPLNCTGFVSNILVTDLMGKPTLIIALSTGMSL